MNIKSSNKVVLVATLLLGFLIMINLNDNTGAGSFSGLSTSEYMSAVEEKNKLISEVNSLIDNNSEIQEKIDKYTNSYNSEAVIEDMKDQLKDYGMLSGLSEVKGPGIVIRINDGKYTYDDADFYKWNKILHDKDVECVLNEIRSAGAEAISLNDHRIIATTGVKCKWAFITFEDGDEEYPTFNFYAIGDPEILLAELTRDGSYINKLINRGLEITMDRKDEIILKAGNISELNYAVENIKNN